MRQEAGTHIKKYFNVRQEAGTHTKKLNNANSKPEIYIKNDKNCLNSLWIYRFICHAELVSASV